MSINTTPKCVLFLKIEQPKNGKKKHNTKTEKQADAINMNI